jgi:hypothetical protein
VLAPKVQGTLALVRALEGLPLDFLVLFSSVTSATGGGPGQVDYCAANAYLNAYAQRHAQEHGLTVAISWGEWLWDAWQEGLQGFLPEVRASFIENRRKYGISFADGAEALRRILCCQLPHVFVTTQDLLAMVQGSKQASATAWFAHLRQVQEARPRYARPVLGSSYVAPRTALEEQIAEVWAEVLGIEQVGIDDNFFELGGNSLLGIDLLARVRKAVQVEKLPAYVLYEASSVSALAAYLKPVPQQTADDQLLEAQAEKRREKLGHFKAERKGRRRYE